MKRLSILLTLLYMISSTIVGAAEVDEVVRDTTSQVLQQLAEDRASLEADPEIIQQVMNELITPHFDFELMSELVLGSHWQALDDSKQTCFVSGFRNLIVERYAYILLSYDNHEITYESTIDLGDKGYKLVRQTITREGVTPLPIDYAMEQAAGTWRVVDLIIDGVSLVRNYLGMFQSQIHIQGLEYFIDNFPVCNN